MPGAFAHMTLVNMLREPDRLEAIPSFPERAIPTVLDYFKYCELGAVSPDYPYLSVGDSDAAKWADLMHYESTGDVIKRAIEGVRGTAGETQRKSLAWLLGYSAHVAMDVTIHPVIELKVGPYHGNEQEHRICEMNQDTFIFQRLNLGDIGLSEHLDSGVSACSSEENPSDLDSDIIDVWANALSAVHPEEFASNFPDINHWHSQFKFMVDNVAEEGNKLFPLARHVAAGQGLTYPSVENVADQYISALDTPDGEMNYDDIFNMAVENVSRVWAWVASGVLLESDEYVNNIGNWNLDTGRDETGTLVFWG